MKRNVFQIDYQGKGVTLSKVNVFQLNRIYNCPGNGTHSYIKLKIGTNQNSYVYRLQQPLVQ